MTDNAPASGLVTQPESKPSFFSKITLFKTSAEMSRSDRIKRRSAKVLALVFWVYAFLKLFVFDVDRWAVGYAAPGYIWILNFKPLFILGMVSALWLWLGTREFIAWLFYIAAYPIINLIVKPSIFVGAYILKRRNWILALAIINIAISFVSNIKFNVIYLTIFLIAMCVAFVSDTSVLLYIAILCLILLVVTAYIRQFISAVSARTIFHLYATVFKTANEIQPPTLALDADLRDLPVDQLGPDQLVKWNESLQNSVIYNRICLFTARTLRDYQRSSWHTIPSLFGILSLAIFTVIVFTGIYHALYKIDPQLFSFRDPPTIFTFLYFSFNALVVSSIEELRASAMLSQSVYMMQQGLIFLLGAILITLVFSHKAQRSSSDLDDAIASAEKAAANVEGWIQSEYRMASITTAMEHLRRAESNMISFIAWLSKGI